MFGMNMCTFKMENRHSLSICEMNWFTCAVELWFTVSLCILFNRNFSPEILKILSKFERVNKVGRKNIFTALAFS